MRSQDRAGHPGMPRRAFARLKPGVTVNQAKLALTPLFAFALNTAPPGLRSLVHLGVRSLRDRQMESMRLTAWTLFATVLAVLLIACANVASLLLARGAARERELATRYALGASRGRLVRQALTESLLLALASALAGCIVASLLLHAFFLMAPSGMLLAHGTQLDLRVISFTVLLSMLCGIGFGILPALHKPSSLARAASTSLGSQHAWLRQCLVAGQIAISIVLLSGASLLLRSLWHLQKQDLGMQTRNVLTVKIALSPQRYDSGHKQQLFYQQLKQAFANLPGVSAVAVSSSLPPGDQDSGRLADMHVPGRPPGPVTSGDLLSRRQVTPGYFQVLDIPIVRGRAFTTEDEHTNQREVIFSQSLAARILPGTNPVGREVQLDPAPGAPLFTVVGIAGNVKNGGITGEDTPEYYRLRRDADEEWEKSAVFLIETGQSSTALAPWVRSAVSRLDPETPVDIQTMKQQVSTFLRWPRFEATLLAVFAFAGLTMAVIGLYGVTSFLATQRVKEIGVRLAVGATRINILLLMMQQGTRIILIGTGLGLAAAFLLSRFVRNSLYGVSSHDPASFIGVSALLALVAFAATMLPAYAAMKIEPTVALRHE